MTPKQAGETVRGWVECHTRAVLHTLACGQVPTADRPDLAQDVFSTAYGILLRSLFTVEHPRAWLCAIAMRRASHFRRDPRRRLCLAPMDDAPSNLATPERGAADRELVQLLLAQLDDEERGVLLDVRAEGLSWDEVAREHGLTVPQARYVYRVALRRVEAARGEFAPASRRSFVLAIALERTFRDLRAEAEVAPALGKTISASIDEAVRAALPMPTNGLEPHPCASSISIRIDAPSATMAVGNVLGLLGAGVALGGLLGCLLRPSGPGEAAPVKPSAVVTSHTVAHESETASRGGDTVATLLRTAEPAESQPRVEAAERSPSAQEHRRPALALRRRLPGPFALLDQARAAVHDDDGEAALAALTEHARRFPRGPGAAERRHLLVEACAIPAAQRAPECLAVPPVLALE